MASLSHDDIRSVFTSAGPSATGSPAASMRTTAKNTSILVDETESNNQRIMKFDREVLTILKDIRKGVRSFGGKGTGSAASGLGLDDLLGWKGRGRPPTGGRRGIGRRVADFGRRVSQFGVKTATTILSGTFAMVKAAGAPLSRLMPAMATRTIRTLVAGAASSLKFLGTVGSGVSGMLRGIATVGGDMGRAVPGLLIGGGKKALSLLRGGGKLLGKVFIPLQAALSAFDAIEGWNNADATFGHTANLREKFSSAVGNSLNSLTFGLTDQVSQIFGWQDTAHVYDSYLQTLGGIGETIWSSATDLFGSISTTIKSTLEGLTTWWNTKSSEHTAAVNAATAGETMGGMYKKPTTGGTSPPPTIPEPGHTIGLKEIQAAGGPVTAGINNILGSGAPSAEPEPELMGYVRVADSTATAAAPTGFTAPEVPWLFTESGTKYWVDKLTYALTTSLGVINGKPKINPLTTPGAPGADNPGAPGAANQNNPDGKPPVAPANPSNLFEQFKEFTKNGGATPTASTPSSGYMTPAEFLSGGNTSTSNGDFRMTPGGSTEYTSDYKPGGGQSGKVSGSSHAAEAVNAMMEEGFTRKEASAVAGNMSVESTFNPAALGDKGSALGLMQWRGQRRQNLMKWAQEKGLDPSTRSAQAKFAVEETRKGSPYADYGSVKARQWMLDNPNASASDMASQFMTHAERPNRQYAHEDRRRTEANSISQMSTEPPPAGAVGPNGPVNNVIESQGKLAGKRKLDIQQQLKANIGEAVYRTLGDGYKAEVYSGGQMSNAPGEGTGTRRHNKGGAADYRIYGPDGKQVSQDQYAKVAQTYLGEGKGSVGMQMKGGGVHFDALTKDKLLKGEALSWFYKDGPQVTPENRARVAAGLKGQVPEGIMSREDYQRKIRPKQAMPLSTDPGGRPDRLVGQDRMPTLSKDPYGTFAGHDAAPMPNGGLAALTKQANPTVDAGLSMLQTTPPEYTPPPPPQPVQGPPAPDRKTKEDRDQTSIDKIRSMDELDMMIWNTSNYG